MGEPGGPQAPLASGREPRFSGDGFWWWDGAGWRPAISPDGAWRWTGGEWVPAERPRPAHTSPSNGALVAIVAATAAVVLVGVSVLAFVGFRGLNSTQHRVSSQQPTAGIPCDQLEQTQVHYHAALQIVDQGTALIPPTDLGRTAGCLYWLHMHTGEPGIIHIEAPADRSFTLGDFFAVWSAWSGRNQLLDARHVSDVMLTPAQSLVAYVDLGDGSGATVYSGDPKSIPLRSREVITLEIAPPVVNPPPTFAWPDGF
ncbi:MAG: hypothetical protein ACHQ0J_07855 [Candidatus Dormibacterales bacterium]